MLTRSHLTHIVPVSVGLTAALLVACSATQKQQRPGRIHQEQAEAAPPSYDAVAASSVA